MKNIKKAILAVLIVFSLAACSIFDEAEPTVVNSVIVDETPIVSATGMIVPEMSSNLSFPLPGRVAEVLVSEGETVSQDQALIVLSGRAQAQAGLSAAELELTSAQQALDDLHETADIASAVSWLAYLDARTEYNAAEEAWDEFDLDDYQDDLDDAQEDVLEAEEDLDDAQETFDRYADLDEDNSLRKRYQDDLDDAQEAYNEEVRVHAELMIERERVEANWQAANAAVAQAELDYLATLSGPDADLLALAESRLAAAEAQVTAAEAKI